MSLIAPGFDESVIVRSAELFYMLDGAAQLLSGEQVVTAERGDLVVVPPGLAHAFAAAPGEDADILIVITPGVERFEYFRHLERIAYGKVPARKPPGRPGGVRHLLPQQPGVGRRQGVKRGREAGRETATSRPCARSARLRGGSGSAVTIPSRGAAACRSCRRRAP